MRENKKHPNILIIASVPANSVQFVDFDVIENTNYTYRIKGYNLLTQSNYSNESSVTSYCPRSQPPRHLSAVLSPTIVNLVELNWQDNSPNESGFIIERKIGDSLSLESFTVIDTVAADLISYIDSTLADTTYYTFRIKAYNQFFQSTYSNLAFVGTVLSTLAAPTNLTVILSLNY